MTRNRRVEATDTASATEATTAAASSSAPCLVAECDALRDTLREVDRLVQVRTEQIAAACRAALKLLSCRPLDLIDAAVLIDLAIERAMTLGEYVDEQASGCDCSSIETLPERASHLVATKVCAEWHALRAGTGAASAKTKIATQ